MKRTHITYLKDLIGTIMKSPIPPSTDLVRLIPEDKIFEAHPREDKFQENAPFCVINHTPITPILDGRRWQKLSSVEISGVKNLRYLRRHFSQEFRYSLNFGLMIRRKVFYPSGIFQVARMILEFWIKV